MKITKKAAPLAAVALAAGLFAVSAVSAASAAPESGDKHWVGETPVFLTSAEAVQEWDAQIAAEQKGYGEQFSFNAKTPGVLLVEENAEGDQHLYEKGLVDSLVARTVRCGKLATWVKDDTLKASQVQENADSDFLDFTQVPEIAQLFDVAGYTEGIKHFADQHSLPLAEAELTYMCADIEGEK